MIYESGPWRVELNRQRRSIGTWAKKTHTRRGYTHIERAIFLSAFVMRKLIENRKVTDRIRNRVMRCTSYRAFRPLSDRVSRFYGVASIDKEYDLSKAQLVQMSLFDLTSEIMHSYVFEPIANERNEFVDFFINSYRNRDDRLLSVNVIAYCDAIDLVSSDEVQSIRVWKDPTTGRVHAEST
jgi:hypothetical protein